MAPYHKKQMRKAPDIRIRECRELLRNSARFSYRPFVTIAGMSHERPYRAEMTATPASNSSLRWRSLFLMCADQGRLLRSASCIRSASALAVKGFGSTKLAPGRYASPMTLCVGRDDTPLVRVTLLLERARNRPLHRAFLK